VTILSNEETILPGKRVIVCFLLHCLSLSGPLSLLSFHPFALAVFRKFYACHRKFLNPEGSFAAPVEFKSKKEFRYIRASSRQSSRDSVNDNNSNDKLSKLVKFQQHDPHRFRHAATVVKNVINFENIMGGGNNSNNNVRGAWVEEFKAGITYWVNKETGDVSTECPYADPIDKAVKRFMVHHKMPSYASETSSASSYAASSLGGHSTSTSSSSSSSNAPSSSSHQLQQQLHPPPRYHINPAYLMVGEEVGTGSLVYDDKEVHELFDLLDEGEKSLRNVSNKSSKWKNLTNQ
jgi:hypothetical protein